MKIEKLGLLAWFLSGLVILTVLIMVPMIVVEIQQIWTDLDNDMDQFRVNTETLWTEIMELRLVVVKPQHESKRQQTKRNADGGDWSGGHRPNSYSIGIKPPGQDAVPQPPGTIDDPDAFYETIQLPNEFKQEEDDRYSQQAVNAAIGPNGCVPQPGPRGFKGPPGRDGKPGRPGRKGPPGEDYVGDGIERLPSFTCTTCPRGFPGRKGPKGSRGKRGSRGAPGLLGNNGRSGQKGFNGGIGPMGAPGKRGGGGPKGPKGCDTERVLGKSGVKGDRGRRGRGGTPGLDGTDGFDGSVGEPGRPGDFGQQGIFPDKASRAGRPGKRGYHNFFCTLIAGTPGNDGGYCKCPDRSVILNAARNRRENY